MCGFSLFLDNLFGITSQRLNLEAKENFLIFIFIAHQ